MLQMHVQPHLIGILIPIAGDYILDAVIQYLHYLYQIDYQYGTLLDHIYKPLNYFKITYTGILYSKVIWKT